MTPQQIITVGAWYERLAYLSIDDKDLDPNTSKNIQNCAYYNGASALADTGAKNFDDSVLTGNTWQTITGMANMPNFLHMLEVTGDTVMSTQDGITSETISSINPVDGASHMGSFTIVQYRDSGNNIAYAPVNNS